jgi:hypothetical protein
MRKFLFFFAVCGWTLGLAAHLLSLAGIDVADKFPLIWLLHVGVFIVWIPIILYLRKNEELKSFQMQRTIGKLYRSGFYKIIFKDAPFWMKIVAVGGLFYAFINFGLFMFSQQGVGTAGIRNGQFVLEIHGHFIKNLTEREYRFYRSNVLRGFSGHWIAFYGLAMAILYPFIKPVENKISVA